MTLARSVSYVATMTDDKRQQQRKFVRQLLEAVDRGDADAATRLVDGALSSGLDVDHPASGGLTVLHSIVSSSSSSSAVVDACRRLIAAGADINRRDPATGETPLHRAVRANRRDLIEVLMESSNVELDATDVNGWTPLRTAIAVRSVVAARCLVQAGCSVNKASDAADTPLTVCARNNLVELTRLLVDEATELDVNATDGERRTALVVAAEQGHEDVARVLIETRGCWLDAADRYNRTALYFAAKYGHVGIVKRLISAGADLNKADTKGLTALTMAVEGLHMDVVKLLIDAGCDINTADHDNKLTAIHNAVRYCAKVFGSREFNQQLVRLLISSNCNVNVADKFGQTPLYQAAAAGETDIVSLLLEKNVDVTKVTSTMDTPLHGSVIGNQPEITDMLIKAGCSVNAVNNKNKLPLYLAIESQAHNEIVRLLLKAGSETDVCESKDHRSPLFAAVSHQYTEAVSLLIEAGCDVNLPDSADNTPLLIACSQGNEAIVDALMRHPKIDIDRGTLQFPLQAAAGVGSCAIVEQLINARCDINKVTLTGMSALFQAADRDRLDVARLLVAHGASPMAAGRRLPRGASCCLAHRDPHPHLEIHPLFAAVENNNLAMIKLLLLASPRMPYAELATLRDIIFRTKYAAEARLSDRTLVQYGYLFAGVLCRPRSLTDECRGAIRDAVCFGRCCRRRRTGGGEYLTLAEAVDRLPLPDRLKDFVMLRGEPIVNCGGTARRSNGTEGAST